MDSGRQRGGTWGSTDPVATSNSVSAQQISLKYARNSYGSHSDTAYLYFGDYETQLKRATPNQIVSARLVLTWKSGTSCKSSNISFTNVSQSWTERSIVDSAPTVSQDGNYQQVDYEFVTSSASENSKTYVNIIDFVRRQITGTPNYGFWLSRFGSVCSDDDAKFYTRESLEPKYRPYVAITIDLSRPALPAPTDAPSGLALTPAVGSVTATWNSVPVNAEKIKIDFSCSVSGALSATVASTLKTATISGLKGGEKCTAIISASSSGGDSPTSMRASEVTVVGLAPNSTVITKLKIEPGLASVEISGTSETATENVVTISCSDSGKQSQTIAASVNSVTFKNLREGETCSASSQSRNEWGISAQGVSSTPVGVPGSAPGLITFTSDSTNPLSVRFSWSNVPIGATIVEARLNCQKLGELARTLTSSDRSTVFSDLTPNDSCVPTMWVSNKWGTSSKSTNSALNVKGTAPSKPDTPGITTEVPLELVINFFAPTGADLVDIYISCKIIGDRTFSDIAVTATRQIFAGAKAGDTCYAAIVAKNEWGSSAKSTFAGPVTVQGKSPSQIPSGLNVSAGVTAFEITWTDGPDESVEITAYCSASGTRKVVVNSNARQYVFNASGGETCSASLASKNQYGLSSSTQRSKSVVILKVQSSTSQSTSKVTATPKATVTPKATAKPKATSSSKPNTSTTSLICIKGSQVKTFSGVNPTCPSGWVKKPTISKQ